MAEHEYTNILPNAHVNWDFREDQKLRFSFSTGISPPDLHRVQSGLRP